MQTAEKEEEKVVLQHLQQIVIFTIRPKPDIRLLRKYLIYIYIYNIKPNIRQIIR